MNDKTNLGVDITLYSMFSLAILAICTELLGLPGGRLASLITICATPLLLFYLNYFKNQRFVIPKNPAILYLFFLIVQLIGLFVCNNFEQRVLGVLFFGGLFSLFILTLNLKKTYENKILKILISLGIIFPVLSIILRNYIYPFYPQIIPSTGYQIITAQSGLHNHMGDFLAIILPILTFYYFSNKQKQFLLLEFILLPFLLYSYSRSAYITFVLTTIMVVVNRLTGISKSYLISLLILILMPVIFLIFTTKELAFISTLQYLYSIKETLLIKDKPLLSPRSEYISEAKYAIAEKPWTGVGFNNFLEYARNYPGRKNFAPESSHNIFLDVAAEQGILAGLIFFALVSVMLKNSTFNIYLILTLGLLVNFQTDYTHRIYAMIFLFFLLCGLAYEDSSNSVDKTRTSKT